VRRAGLTWPQRDAPSCSACRRMLCQILPDCLLTTFDPAGCRARVAPSMPQTYATTLLIHVVIFSAHFHACIPMNTTAATMRCRVIAFIVIQRLCNDVCVVILAPYQLQLTICWSKRSVILCGPQSALAVSAHLFVEPLVPRCCVDQLVAACWGCQATCLPWC
jgi:hypothetical protein